MTLRWWLRGMGLAAAALLAAAPARADDSVTASNQDGYSRLTFDFAPLAHVRASVEGGVLTLRFDRRTTLDPEAMARLMGPAVSGVRADADGRTFRFALTLPVRLHESQVGARAAVDVAAADFTGTMPDLPQPGPPPKPKPVDPARLPPLALRVGSYSDHTRLVFDWPQKVPYTVYRGAGTLTVTFAAPARPDLSAIARFAPAWVEDAAWHLEGRTTVVTFRTDPDCRYHAFRDGTHMVLDVLAPKADARAGVSPAQMRAIEAAAGEKPAAPPAAAAKAATKAPVKTAAAADTAAPASGGALTFTFRGAAARPAAVFVRGLTAWIVLEDATQSAASLKAALKGFDGPVEALTGAGTAVLRLTLPGPGSIASHSDGPDLSVTLDTKAAPDTQAAPDAITFSRDGDGLTAYLPLADRRLTLADPAAGDSLTVIPGASGYGLAAPRRYAAFTALPSAQGLVLSPRASGLTVGVAHADIRIARPGGLLLTPPRLTLDAGALAGRTVLDFARWGRIDGDFLATTRRLQQAVLQRPDAEADDARLVLARFYLANHFAPEALGLLDRIQASDPTSAGDAQLIAMRGAADVMMGRWRDARNALAPARFDGDPGIALWRGLAEAGEENWSPALADLATAAPVIGRYPPAWQARARLAEAEAALGLGRLDRAGTALSALPRNLPQDAALEAELVRARLAALSGSYAEAAPQFRAVENGGDERLAVRAIYYDTDAALKAKAISVSRAIDRLERLRFRWRGDSLELMTLTRLGGLYLARHDWARGFKTLRTAADNFQGDERARQAQDAMRTAFAGLFLKGGADTMRPVASLGLFYDNMDLTPIGAEGDAMIRRMAERLVRVDLLGPAEKLLSWQVDKRLDGIAKAEVATRLAAIDLMDAKPQDAIDALRGSEVTGLSDAVIHARLLLEARALAALKQWRDALDMLAVDDGADTRRLVADIDWESGNWEAAGQAAEALVGNDTAPLDADARALVLRMAVAYSLAGDEASLARLRGRFAARMAATDDGAAFAVLSAPIALHGLAFRDAAKKIAALDTLEPFMKGLGKSL